MEAKALPVKKERSCTSLTAAFGEKGIAAIVADRFYPPVRSRASSIAQIASGRRYIEARKLPSRS